MPTRTSEEQTAILNHAIAYVKHLLEGEATGHDWPHIDRVRKMAVRIAQAEELDPFLPELTAILHEVADRKIVGEGQEELAYQNLANWLNKHQLTEEEIAEVMYVIRNQSYSVSGIQGKKLQSVIGQVVQDADRLEALGAIGIARVFAYNGKKGNILHDPAIPARTGPLSKEQYQQLEPTAINHFYEKLLKLRDLMNTKTARQIADQRHRFMENFLEEFYAEWNGER